MTFIINQVLLLNVWHLCSILIDVMFTSRLYYLIIMKCRYLQTSRDEDRVLLA